MRLFSIFLLAAVCLSGLLAACTDNQPTGQTTLRVVLIPADGGTADGTLADYAPLFRRVGALTGVNFQLTVGSSYNSVVDAMCSGAADVAFLGPVTYLQAEERGCAEFLATGAIDGQSVYYAGLFVRQDSPIESPKDAAGHSVAFGDINSTSSFVFPLAILLEEGIDPTRDLSAIRLTGTHANSLAALSQGQVDVAGASFESFEKAIRQSAVDPGRIRVLARSAAIPYPPLAMNTQLPEETKLMLREAFAHVHEAPGTTPDMIRGYGGELVERYDTEFAPAAYADVSRNMARIDDHLRAGILKKAAER